MFLKKEKEETLTIQDCTTVSADFISEEFRFLKAYNSAINKLHPEERIRYQSTLDFHNNQILEFAEKMQLKIVQLEGKRYDDGLPIRALNIEDFQKEDELVIEQVIEPLIISASGGVIRSGSVMLIKNSNVDKKDEKEEK